MFVPYLSVVFFWSSIAKCSDDPYASLRVKKNEVHPITQEIIKLGLKTHGIHYFDVHYQEAKKRADAHNADQSYDHSRMLPSWSLETYFYPANQENDPLTKTIVEAVAKEKTKEGREVKGVIPGATRYKVQDDGAIRCKTRMTGYPYIWAKEYSKNLENS